jgi:hypothetical protein
LRVLCDTKSLSLSILPFFFRPQYLLPFVAEKEARLWLLKILRHTVEQYMVLINPILVWLMPLNRIIRISGALFVLLFSI